MPRITQNRSDIWIQASISTYCSQTVMIVRTDARNVADRTNVMIEGIVVKMKVMSVKTSATVNRKRSAMECEATRVVVITTK
jgi:hypothetical protein